jgi:signal transduction histidine kinase/HD-like signal output (HDOD) protein
MSSPVIRQIAPGLLARIETARNMPTLPHILLKLMEVCEREDCTMGEIAQIIDKDPSLSIKVLNVVNSPFYRRSERMVRVEQAIFQLGKDVIKNITIGASVYHAFSGLKGSVIFSLKHFWHHSLHCAVLARILAEKTAYPAPEEAFLAGLIHDIGRLLLWNNFPEEYSRILVDAQNDSDLLYRGEQEMGALHTEVGAWLLDQWHMQSLISDTILYHHEPIERILDAFPLVKIVYAANILSVDLLKSSGHRRHSTEEIFGLSSSEVDDMIIRADEEVKDLAEALNIRIADGAFAKRTLTAEDGDRGTERQLIDEVRDISLIQGTLQNLVEAIDEDAILSAIQKGIRILLDIKSIFFFIYDAKKDVLSGKRTTGDEEDDPIYRLSIPLGKIECLLVKCILQGVPLDSFGFSERAPITIMDEQLIRLIGGEGIICLPLISRNRRLGVIVLGVNANETSHLLKKVRLLNLLSKQAALALHLDFTRRNQARIVEAERMAESVRMARKVAHEVNNPLSIIKNYLKILSLKLGPESDVQDGLRIINEEIDRVRAIIREMSNISDHKNDETGPVDINALLSDLVRIIRESISPGIKLNIHLDLYPGLPKVIAVKNKLKQVFMNLIKNAVEAMPDGGNIFISTASPSRASGEGAAMVTEGKEVEIIILDDGPGIPDAIRLQLYEPCVTTKGEGHSGLGLSIVQQIVKELGGKITCESTRWKGTAFKVVFPPQGKKYS